jgi:hypothetical protein
MTMYHYADENQKTFGPVSLDELRKLAQEGIITADTYVISEGQTTWIRYGDLITTAGEAAVAEAIASRMQQMGKVLSKFRWGDLFFGLLLVLINVLTLPFHLLKRSAMSLANWGENRTLPTAQSDLPVLTFLIVVLRPVFHLLFTVLGVLGCLGYVLTSQQPPGEKVVILLLVPVGIYLFNFAIGFFFDCISVFIVMANSLKNIERK